MKILMVLDREFPPDLRVENEIETLTKEGNEIFLACYTRENRPLLEKKDHLTVFRRHIPEIIYKSSVAALTFPLYFRFWRSFLDELFRKYSFDAIHIHDLPLVGTGLIYRKKYGIPLTADLHENWPAYLRIATHTQSIAGRILSPNRKWVEYEAEVLRDSDHIVVVVEEARDRLITMGLDGNKIVVVSNTLNIAHAHIPREKKNNTTPVLFYAGGINYHRGLQTVIRAMARTKKNKYRLIILGEGSYRKHLIRLTGELGLTGYVQLPGWKPYQEMLKWMGKADFALIPHLKSDHTDSTVPHKLFQYMYAEIPVIASNCKPIERIIRETGAGIIFPSDNDSQLASLLEERILENTKDMGRKGKEWVIKKYNWEEDAKRLISIYN